MLTEREAAKKLKLVPGTLANWRVQGRGPAWVEIGPHCIRYQDEAIDRYIADRVIDPENMEPA